jgi:hypothetical protein
MGIKCKKANDAKCHEWDQSFERGQLPIVVATEHTNLPVLKVELDLGPIRPTHPTRMSAIGGKGDIMPVR